MGGSEWGIKTLQKLDGPAAKRFIGRRSRRQEQISRLSPCLEQNVIRAGAHRGRAIWSCSTGIHHLSLAANVPIFGSNFTGRPMPDLDHMQAEIE
jgi:hypothetical protein